MTIAKGYLDILCSLGKWLALNFDFTWSDKQLQSWGNVGWISLVDND